MPLGLFKGAGAAKKPRLSTAQCFMLEVTSKRLSQVLFLMRSLSTFCTLKALGGELFCEFDRAHGSESLLHVQPSSRHTTCLEIDNSSLKVIQLVQVTSSPQAPVSTTAAVPVDSRRRAAWNLVSHYPCKDGKSVKLP